MNNLNSTPPSFSIEHIDSSNYTDHDQLQLQPLGPNLQVDSSSSSSSASYRFFLDQTDQDHGRYYHLQAHDHQEDANLTYETIKKSTVNIGLKLTLWKKDDHEPSDNMNMSTRDPVKWMSSKMRLMRKMKNPDVNLATKRLRSDNQKLQSYSSMKTDHHSGTNGLSPNNNNIISGPIRVCADCNTTKTPLWRSGPKGPKSLCNACGIRQRKARRAMAAAAAANGMAVACDRTPTIKFKVPHKDKTIPTSKNGHSSHINKRCKIANYNDNADAANMGSTSNGQINKISKLEDFLIKLSNNLAFHRVFPQDEKDAAILLMALSSGLVHG